MVTHGDKPEDVVGQYNKNSDDISQEEFHKFCTMEYELKDSDSKRLWGVLRLCKSHRALLK